MIAESNHTGTSPASGTATPYHPAVQVPNHGNSTNDSGFTTVAEPTGRAGLPADPVSINLGSPARGPAGNFQISKESFYPPEFLEKEVVIYISPQELDIEHPVLVEGVQGMENVCDLVTARSTRPLLPAQEYLFIVDRSISMTGKRISRAKEALVIMLKCLPSPPIRTFFVSYHLVHDSNTPGSDDFI